MIKYKVEMCDSVHECKMIRFTVKHLRQSVWAHGRNFGFLISSSNSHRQMLHVTKLSISSGDEVQTAAAILMTSKIRKKLS